MEEQPPRSQPASAEPRSSNPLDPWWDLWKDAPAWRLMVASSAALFMASAATAVIAFRHETPGSASSPAQPEQPSATVPPPQPSAALVPPNAPPQPPASAAPPATGPAAAPNETDCGYKGGVGRSGQGQVIGFLSAEQAAQLLAASQQNTGAKINPSYAGTPRVVITSPNGERTVVILPAGMTVKPGDRVAFAGYRRDWSMACGYIPNLIIGVLQSR